MRAVGVTGLLTILSHLFFIGVTFKLLQSFRFDQLIKRNHVRDGQLLMWFITIALGYTVSSFFLNLIQQFQNLIYIFQ